MPADQDPEGTYLETAEGPPERQDFALDSATAQMLADTMRRIQEFLSNVRRYTHAASVVTRQVATTFLELTNREREGSTSPTRQPSRSRSRDISEDANVPALTQNQPSTSKSSTPLPYTRKHRVETSWKGKKHLYIVKRRRKDTGTFAKANYPEQLVQPQIIKRRRTDIPPRRPDESSSSSSSADSHMLEDMTEFLRSPSRTSPHGLGPSAQHRQTSSVALSSPTALEIPVVDVLDETPPPNIHPVTKTSSPEISLEDLLELTPPSTSAPPGQHTTRSVESSLVSRACVREQPRQFHEPNTHLASALHTDLHPSVSAPTVSAPIVTSERRELVPQYNSSGSSTDASVEELNPTVDFTNRLGATVRVPIERISSFSQWRVSHHGTEDFIHPDASALATAHSARHQRFPDSDSPGGRRCSRNADAGQRSAAVSKDEDSTSARSKKRRRDE